MKEQLLPCVWIRIKRSSSKRSPAVRFLCAANQEVVQTGDPTSRLQAKFSRCTRPTAPCCASPSPLSLRQVPETFKTASNQNHDRLLNYNHQPDQMRLSIIWMDSTRCLKNFSEILLNTDWMYSHNWSWFVIHESPVPPHQGGASRNLVTAGAIWAPNTSTCSRSSLYMIGALYHVALNCWKWSQVDHRSIKGWSYSAWTTLKRYYGA